MLKKIARIAVLVEHHLAEVKEGRRDPKSGQPVYMRE